MLSTRYFLLFKQTVRNFTTENIIKSKAKSLQLPRIPLHEYLWKNLDNWSDKTAVVCFETQRSYTYQQLYKKSLAVTHFLKESLKFKNQDTIAIVLPNIPEYPIVFLGAVQAGLCITTCNPNYTPNEIKKQLEDSESRLVFTTNNLVPLVRQATNIPIVEINTNNTVTNGVISFKEISSGEISQPVSGIDIDEVAFLPYSSGTTGLPKGVQLSHFNIVSNLSQMTAPEFSLINKTEGNDQDVVPAILPFFHIYGFSIIMLQALSRGAKLITMPKFSSNNFVTLLKNYKIDVLYGVPLVVILANNNPHITKEDLVKLRCILCGAAPLGASDVERFHKKTDNKISIVQGYGMTETSTFIMMQTQKLNNGIKVGGSGLLIPNTEARIIPINDPTVKNLKAHETGELVIKGPQVMKGYFKNPEADKNIFLDKEWLRTGDIVYYDENEHFFVVDRCKELIKVKGFQVPPAELEEVIRGHPNVDDVGVMGIPHPQLGEVPKAFVVPKPGRTIKPEELQEFVAAKVAKHKQLSGGVVVVDAIPKSASGKILRRELKNLLETHL